MEIKQTTEYQQLLQENEILKNQLQEFQKGFVNLEQTSLVHGGSLLYSLIQSLPLSIYAKDLSGRFVFANNYYCRNLGQPEEEIIGKTDFDIHPPTLAEKYLADDERIMAFRKIEAIEEEWKSIGGEKSFVKVIKSPLYEFGSRSEVQKIVGTMGIFWDITERKVAEEKLVNSEEKYRQILENIQEGYIELDNDLNLVFCNDSFCSLFSLSSVEMLTRNILDLVDESAQRSLRSFLNLVLFQNIQSESGDFTFISPEPSPLTLNLSISPLKSEKHQVIGIRVVVRNISETIRATKEKQELEKQLAQAQKLESIGTLAGGIAHDFNNILFIIQGYTDLAITDLSKQRDPSVKLTKVREATTRAMHLIEQMLSFARTSEKQRIPIDIRPVVKEALKLLRSALPATITINKDINSSGQYFVLADPTEIHQVVMNLCTNAGQEMADTGGVLEVTLDHCDIPENEPQRQPGLKSGSYLLITIKDSGKGIADEDLSRIFEPFFTTKPVGEGTGLGLSVVHGIITGMDGFIFVESFENVGTTFTIYLPTTEKIITHKKSSEKVIPKGTHEHILLVEDDEVLREMISNMLEELNYTCTTAANGTEGFEIFNTQPEKFDLLLTDQTMPGLTGDALSLAVRAINQTLPIILCTGFSEKLSAEKSAELGIDIFLSKPILVESLADALHTLLHKNP